jgi:hypothetical protein
VLWAGVEDQSTRQAAKRIDAQCARLGEAGHFMPT